MSSAFTWGEAPAGLSRRSLGLLVFDAKDRDVNVLTEDALRDLAARVAEIRARGHEGVVLVSGKRGTFCAGADVDVIARVSSASEGAAKAAFGQATYRALATCGVPVVAAIGGACVGGGAELALWCTARVATWDDRTRIGFPEVQLGIVPGFGGTQMLPRVAGLRTAIDLASSGRLLSAKEALRARLVDSVVEPEHLLAEAARLVERALAGTLRRGDWTSRPVARDLVTALARRAVAKATRGRYPAPAEAVRLCRLALSSELGAGLEAEARTLGDLVVSPVSKKLVHVYFLKRDAERGGTRPPKGALAGVIGAGVMGAGIAGVAAAKGHRARVRDLDAAALGRGAATVAEVTSRATRKARDPRVAARAALDRVSFTLSLDGLREADLVIEAVVERMDVKRAVLAEVEAAAGPSTLIATNTSSLSVAEMAGALRDPSRFVGLHFFNPVPKMPLVEIVASPATSPEALQRARGWVLALGKTPVVVKDAPGFLVNRLLMPYLQEALTLQTEGVGVDAVDAAAKGFGMPMGPFRVLDEVGLDVARHVAATFAGAWPDRFRESAVLARLVSEGRLGTKSGGGFWERRGRRHRPWSGLGPATTTLGSDAIATRLFGAMAAEAELCLAEGVCAGEADLDLATIFGIGFPPFRGGLATWMRARA